MVRLTLAGFALFVSVSVSAPTFALRASTSATATADRSADTQSPQPAATAFERFKAMEGEWIDVTGAFGTKGAVVATYRVTGAGHTIIETFPINTPHEMTTVYHRDGSHVVLTHYCSGGTQPRMRAREIQGNVMNFEFDGGTNIDPAKTSHMHNVRWEFISKDEIKAEWHNWAGGKEDPKHLGRMHLKRKLREGPSVR